MGKSPRRGAQEDNSCASSRASSVSCWRGVVAGSALPGLGAVVGIISVSLAFSHCQFSMGWLDLTYRKVLQDHQRSIAICNKTTCHTAIWPAPLPRVAMRHQNHQVCVYFIHHVMQDGECIIANNDGCIYIRPFH